MSYDTLYFCGVFAPHPNANFARAFQFVRPHSSPPSVVLDDPEQAKRMFRESCYNANLYAWRPLNFTGAPSVYATRVLTITGSRFDIDLYAGPKGFDLSPDQIEELRVAAERPWKG